MNKQKKAAAANTKAVNTKSNINHRAPGRPVVDQGGRPHSIVLYDKDRQLIDRLQAKLGTDGISDTIRAALKKAVN